MTARISAQCGSMPAGTGAAGARPARMPREIADAVDPDMVIRPRLHVVGDALMSHVAVPMAARTDVVPCLAALGTNSGLGRCATAVCGLRLPSDAAKVSHVDADGASIESAVSCRTCRLIVEAIRSARAPSIEGRMG